MRRCVDGGDEDDEGGGEDNSEESDEECDAVLDGMKGCMKVGCDAAINVRGFVGVLKDGNRVIHNTGKFVQRLPKDFSSVPGPELNN